MLSLWTEFFEELQNIRGRSQNTIMAYQRDLELYQEFVNSSLNTSQLFEFLKKRKLSSRSQARFISSVRTYLKFCENHGLTCPELRELRQPKIKTSLPKPITLEQFKALFESAVEKDPHLTKRNQLTLALLFGLGCRVTELIQLNLSDIHEVEKHIKVLGKGGKERLVPMNDFLVGLLLDYLRNVRPFIVKHELNSEKEPEYLVVNDRGHRPSRVDIWRWLSAWSAQAGFQETISPHQFRHGCATALLDSGADLRSIQLLLGHTSIKTTQIYTSVSSAHLKSTIENHHPLSGAERHGHPKNEIPNL